MCSYVDPTTIAVAQVAVLVCGCVVAVVAAKWLLNKLAGVKDIPPWTGPSGGEP